MAVTLNKCDTNLVLRVVIGKDEKGNDKLKSKTFSKVKTDAKDEDLFLIGKEIEKILDYKVKDIRRVDDSMLINE